MTNTNMGRPVGNKHKVPKKQWVKWSNHAKKIFNELYESMVGRGQWKFLHVKQPAIPKNWWQVTAWNASWTAASIADGEGRLGKIIQDGKLYSRRPPGEGKLRQKKPVKRGRR